MAGNDVHKPPGKRERRLKSAERMKRSDRSRAGNIRLARLIGRTSRRASSAKVHGCDV